MSGVAATAIIGFFGKSRGLAQAAGAPGWRLGRGRPPACRANRERPAGRRSSPRSCPLALARWETLSAFFPGISWVVAAAISRAEMTSSGGSGASTGSIRWFSGPWHLWITRAHSNRAPLVRVPGFRSGPRPDRATYFLMPPAPTPPPRPAAAAAAAAAAASSRRTTLRSKPPATQIRKRCEKATQAHQQQQARLNAQWPRPP